MPSKTPVDADPHRENCDHPVDRTLQPLPSGVTAGCRVVVRSRRWRLDAIDSYEDCCGLHLTSTEDEDSRVLLWPFDRPVADRLRQHAQVLRPRVWLHHLREAAEADRPAIHLLTQTGGAPPAILPYQIQPALEIAAGARRVLLADEVGLGKTIEAGWIVTDTIARRPDARVLIAVPAGLRAQWAQELRRFFAVNPIAVDARSLIVRISDLPPDVNVWTPPGVYIVSLDFLKRPDIAASAQYVVWDLLVVDEAHVATMPTERHRALEPIARRSRVVVLLTATPFSGDDASFASLMSLGGAPGDDPPRMFRRSRGDVGDRRRRHHRFARVRLTRVERGLQRMLHRYCREVWSNAPSSEGRLAAIVLRKRGLSSPGALSRSLRRRLRLLSASQEFGVQLSLFPQEIDEEDAEPSTVLAAPGLTDAGRERSWLERLIAAADSAGGANSKLEYLQRLLRRLRGEAAVVFTEFRDTLADLADLFPEALRIHGGLTPGERAAVQAQFNAAGGLLFATDAAAYGLNLHGCCRLVVNFELPWNPARLEQRIGRVDRIGQARAVHATTLVAGDTAEDFVVANVARRLWRVAASFGPGDRLAALLDDARVAGMVVGNEPVVDLIVPPLVARQEVSPAAIQEAARLKAVVARATAPPRYSRRDNRARAITSIASSATLPPGIVTLVQWTLREPSGRLVACRTLTIHVSERFSRPARAADARRIALEFLAAHSKELLDRASVEFSELRRRSADAHGLALHVQAERERQMLPTEEHAHPSQPGLFDHRVQREAAAVEAHRGAIREETQRRLRSISNATAIEDRIEIIGLLLLWSDGA
ncbi:MAG TPA: helicase-related protein [Vicinamibacterales bacterium]|nr:helicase-related protein [Vicinamibacterales bacterium]